MKEGERAMERGRVTSPDAMLCVIDYLMRNLYLARIGRKDGLAEIELAFPFRGGREGGRKVRLK